ncbi:response regulator [Flavobacterium sp. PLA-1-15]|uniref:response regulator n=1 Tax=Flavobacterium sp. PLA-1-15 TaxID=3380533 RepID=UPI003B7D706C
MDNPSNQPLIYLVDDDQDDREMFTTALALINPEADVIEFSDGQQLLDALAENPHTIPNYIFLDLNMPKCTGMECIEQMAHNINIQNTTIAILSTSSNPDSIEKAFQLGAGFYIIKPTSFTNLKSFIGKVLSPEYQNTKAQTIKDFLLTV